MGAFLAALTRAVLVVTDFEPYMGPPALLYPVLTAMLAIILWLVFFNRV